MLAVVMRSPALPIGFPAGLRSPRLAGRRDRGRPFELRDHPV